MAERGQVASAGWALASYRKRGLLGNWVTETSYVWLRVVIVTPHGGTRAASTNDLVSKPAPTAGESRQTSASRSRTVGVLWWPRGVTLVILDAACGQGKLAWQCTLANTNPQEKITSPLLASWHDPALASRRERLVLVTDPHLGPRALNREESSDPRPANLG